ncbi:MAG: O-antigen ligase family protein [Candidatus Omnitrophota bacterium]
MGATQPWTITLFALAALILFNLTVFSPGFSLKKLFLFPVIALSAVFLAYLLFQLIPLPQPLLKLVSPATYKLYAEYSLAYSQTGNWRPISIYPWLSVTELIKLISYGFIFVTVLFRAFSAGNSTADNETGQRKMAYLCLGCLTGMLAILIHSLVDFNLHICANAFYFSVLFALAAALNAKNQRIDRKFIYKVINAIILTGFIIAVFGIAHKLSGSHKIYWLIKKDGSHFGPYINYDHYAGYMGMCAGLAVAFFMAEARFSSFFLIKGIRNKLNWLSSSEASRAISYLFYSIIMSGSIFYSSSRGGIISFIIAELVFLFVIIIRARKNRRGRLAFFFALAVSLSALISYWIGPDATYAKFRQLNKIIRSVIHEPAVLSEMRPDMWSDTLKIARDFPLTGTGFGTFPSIFPKYRTHEWRGQFLRYAHCDYLQLASETGVIGLLFIIGFLVYFTRLYVFTLRKIN